MILFKEVIEHFCFLKEKDVWRFIIYLIAQELLLALAINAAYIPRVKFIKNLEKVGKNPLSMHSHLSSPICP